MSQPTFMQFAAALIALALPSCASAQETKAKKYAETNGWTIQSFSQDGGYLRCGATASGATYSFQKSSEGFTLLVASSTKGDEAKGVVKVGDKSFGGAFYRMDDNRLGSFLKPPQLEAIKRAKSLSVTIGAERTQISLDGAPAALRKLAECDAKGGE
ncbi:hypothetical protein MSC49_00060 [Methylosinus sp. C49]|uniref:hypothetical protein n=1 Tax=Methylosinus sp. C49 TaxID=2699395 RepID=UPI0013678DEC|nr:hypothetical protein [Methylosinus sp. C49]BBU60071.1 hypothetical protein MSC49_00060 [Methylosinus sp. C49]